jgi:hypothetical protein
VTKGFKQVSGRDYDEVFAPTVETATLRTVLADMIERDAYAGQFDFSTAFLNGELLEVIYIRQPQELGGCVWRLKKALYGLRQAARKWHRKLCETMEELGFVVSDVDPCLFTRSVHGERLVVVIQVDDGVCTGPRARVMAALDEIGKKLEIKKLGEAHVCLSMEIRRRSGRVYLGQETYISDLLARFNMSDCKPVRTPVEVGKIFSKDGKPVADSTPYAACFGALLYVATMTRPDISYAVGSSAATWRRPRQSIGTTST